MPEKSPAKRHNPHDPVGELKRFVSLCAQVRKQLDPETAARAISGFIDGLDDDSKTLVMDLSNIFRRPR